MFQNAIGKMINMALLYFIMKSVCLLMELTKGMSRKFMEENTNN